ncbi:hypothetical protein OQA88_11255 [Cercophora sp. LCS_1]
MITSATPSFINSLAICSWTLWAVALVSVISRFISRRLQTGPPFFRDLLADDYLMLLAFACLTGVVISSSEVAKNGSNYVPEGETDDWTPAEVSQAEWGSKMLVALEEFMVGVLWVVKACLLLLYARMTSGLRESLAVKITAGYCFLTFIIVQVLYLGVWCRPITNYWAVPIPSGNEQCKTYHNHLITVTVLHVSSDLLMLCIPIPMIARSRLPLKRKIVLCGVFGLGVLVVLLAILNRYYNFVMPHDLVFLAWYNGEASTAVMTANVPFCWALLRRVFALDSWAGSSGGKQVIANTGPPTIGSGQRGSRFGRRRDQTLLESLRSRESGSRERITKDIELVGRAV